jgi:hypothetical protein
MDELVVEISNAYDGLTYNQERAVELIQQVRASKDTTPYRRLVSNQKDYVIQTILQMATNNVLTFAKDLTEEDQIFISGFMGSEISHVLSHTHRILMFLLDDLYTGDLSSDGHAVLVTTMRNVYSLRFFAGEAYEKVLQTIIDAGLQSDADDYDKFISKQLRMFVRPNKYLNLWH